MDIKPIKTYRLPITTKSGAIAKLSVYDGDDMIRYNTEKFIEESARDAKRVIYIISGLVGFFGLITTWRIFF